MRKIVSTSKPTHVWYFKTVSVLTFVSILFLACQETVNPMVKESRFSDDIVVSTPVVSIPIASTNAKNNLQISSYSEDLPKENLIAEGDVVGVLSGTQIKVDIDDKMVIVTYEGINVPGNDGMVSQAAKDLNKFLVKGNRVIIEYDSADNSEPNEKIIGYVYVFGELVNSRLIGSGFTVVDVKKDFRMRENFERLQKEAMNLKLGVWDKDLGTICGTLPC